MSNFFLKMMPTRWTTPCTICCIIVFSYLCQDLCRKSQKKLLPVSLQEHIDTGRRWAFLMNKCAGQVYNKNSRPMDRVRQWLRYYEAVLTDKRHVDGLHACTWIRVSIGKVWVGKTNKTIFYLDTHLKRVYST